MPDVYAVWEGLPIWLELKVINSDKVKLSPQQVAWHTSHSHAGGLSFILVKRSKDRGLFLFEGRDGRSVASEGIGSRTENLCSGFSDLWDRIYRVGSGHYRDRFGVGSGSGRG